MKVLRLLAFVAVVALVYVAQYIFDHGTLAGLYPQWLLTLFPLLRRTTRWLPADMFVFAQWISAIGLLSFGLLSPMWTGETNRLYRRMRGDAAGTEAHRWRLAAWVLLAAALLPATLNLITPARGAEPGWLLWSWLGSILLVAASGYAYSRGTPRVVYARRYLEQVRPWQNWHGLIILLVVAALLYTFDLRGLPARVDEVSAAAGLLVRRVLQGETPLFFGSTDGGMALPALALAALTTWISRDGLLGIRLAGTAAGLLMVTSVWLVAGELFRRVPRYGEFGEVLEDDGRWLTFLAAALAAAGTAMYHFARMPVYLEAAALGTLSIWALLCGLRTDRPWLLGASGLALGCSWLYGPLALTFGLVALSVWIGVSILERGWLTGKAVLARDATAIAVQRGAGWAGFALWAAGLLVSAAPLIGRWLGGAGDAAGPLAWPLLAGATSAAGVNSLPPALAQLGSDLRLTLFGLNQLPDQSGLVLGSGHLLPSLLAPLVLLAVGALLLNLDSIMGWVVVTWLGSALAGAAIVSPTDPFWPALLPILPALALALAFFMDRARVLLMDTLGTWTLQATVYLALGIVVAAGMSSWLAFFQAASNDSDLASAIGRAADLPPDDVTVIVVNGQENLERVVAQPVVRLLAGDETAIQTIQLQGGSWPKSLPTPARVLVAPADVGLIPLVDSLYPGGVWQAQRNLQANPVLYIYDLAEGDVP